MQFESAVYFIDGHLVTGPPKLKTFDVYKYLRNRYIMCSRYLCSAEQKLIIPLFYK